MMMIHAIGKSYLTVDSTRGLFSFASDFVGRACG